MVLSGMTGAYLQVIRLPNLFTAVSNILAAHLIGNGGVIHWSGLLLLSFASTCLYSAGMVLNDCFDLEEDRRERPERPLASEQIPIAHAWMLGWGLIGCGVLFTALAGVRSLIIGLFLGGAIVLYNGWAKHNWAGGLIMGTCRYLNWLLGFVVTHVSLSAAIYLAIPIFFYTAALTTLSKIETNGDDRRPILLCALGMSLSVTTIVLLNYYSLLPHAWVLGLSAAGAALVFRRLWALYINPSAATVQQAVMILVLGIIPFDALMVLNGGPWWGAIAVALLITPSKMLARRLYVT
jgi:4-hydroxybenzoate polyprenyltransferase